MFTTWFPSNTVFSLRKFLAH
uniref:Uncharacterized protein n=1 Tax=Rhizophora mucronata TaxID=61149 RepID=A0A2P2QJN8_RHIMU